MIRPRLARRAGWLAGALILALAGCQPAGPTDAPRSATSGGSTPSPEPVFTLGPPPSPTQPDVTTPLVLDPTVLAFLPETVNGVLVTESTDEATQALADAALPRIASAMDAGIAVDSGNANLVAAWVVRLRPDKFTEATYQLFRDAYDEGRCQAAGGVEGRAQATIDGRTVYITTCIQGLRTYHLWLQDAGILIAAWSVGEARFGEVLMDNLRVPA